MCEWLAQRFHLAQRWRGWRVPLRIYEVIQPHQALLELRRKLLRQLVVRLHRERQSQSS